MRPRLAALLLLAALAPLAAGCGGGGKKSNTAIPDSTFVGTTTAPTVGTTTRPSGGTTTKSKSCKDLTPLAGRIVAAFQNNTSARNIRKNAKLLKQFADRTPGEIRPDFELLAADVQKLAASLHGANSAGPLTAAQRRQFKRAARSIDQAKLTQAIQHITTWSQQNC